VGRIVEEALQGERDELAEEGPTQVVRLRLEPAQDLVALFREPAGKGRP
jgi:hypothetical protein